LRFGAPSASRSARPWRDVSLCEVRSEATGRILEREANTLSDAGWRSMAVMPLLLELMRALRARRFYLPGDPAQAAVLQRSARVWTAAFARRPTLNLKVDAVGFELGDATRLAGSGVRDLATLLHAAGIERLVVTPAVRADEFQRFVELLAQAADSAAPIEGGLRAALSRADLTHICVGGDDAGPAFDEEIQARESAGAAEDLDPPGDDGRIEQLIAELEATSDEQAYSAACAGLTELLRARMAERDFVDAYRVALALGRHCAGVGRKAPCNVPMRRVRAPRSRPCSSWWLSAER